MAFARRLVGMALVAASGCTPTPDAPLDVGTSSDASTSTDSESTAVATATSSDGSESDGSSGGDPRAPAVGLHESGARLRARVLDAGEGATVFVGWWDANLEIECQISIAPDGSPRCLPAPLPIVFVDAACTEPAIAAADPDALAHTFAAAVASTCDGPPVLGVFTLGPAVSPATTYDRFLGDCTPSPDLGSPQLFALEPDEIDRYAGGEIVSESHGELDVEVFVGDDGSRMITTVRDPGTAHACGMSPIAVDERDASGACLPLRAAGLSTSVDGSCFGDIAYTCKPIDCADPAVVIAVDDACGSDYEVFAVGAPVGADAGICAPPIDSPVCPYYEVGASIDPSTFGALQLAPRGEGRVRAHDVITGDGQTVASFVDPFWDEELATHCRMYGGFEWLASETRVCLADVASTWVGFADAECTRPVVGVQAGCGDRPPSYAESDFDPWDDIFGGTSRLYPIEGPLEGDTVYTPGDCAAAGYTGELWIVGDEITSSDALPTIVARTE